MYRVWNEETETFSYCNETESKNREAWTEVNAKQSWASTSKKWGADVVPLFVGDIISWGDSLEGAIWEVDRQYMAYPNRQKTKMEGFNVYDIVRDNPDLVIKGNIHEFFEVRRNSEKEPYCGELSSGFPQKFNSFTYAVASRNRLRSLDCHSFWKIYYRGQECTT